MGLFRGGDGGCGTGSSIQTFLRFLLGPRALPTLCGVLLTFNFLGFWALPIAGMGLTWKCLLKPVFGPVYASLDQSLVVRRFAESCIYTNTRHADFFVTSVLLLINFAGGMGTLLYWQYSTGSLPAWLVAMYYCSWVGTGGRIMGAAYALAHREAHHALLYKKWIRDSAGNFFENWFGPFYGNIPFNFSTSHVRIHHALDGGYGDTFYQWDLNRASVADFMLYVSRIFLHMIGYSSLCYFEGHNQREAKDKLTRGIARYVALGVLLFALTRSLNFVFWIYVQPLFCMSYFLALLNFGFHAFIEHDENGTSIPCVNATTIVDGEDDYWGEDDHMSHHYNTSVYFRDLKPIQQGKEAEFKKYHASVFREISIVELSICIVLGIWSRLADQYVDHSGSLSKQAIMDMLKARAERTETSYEAYQHEFLSNPTKEARTAFSKGK